MEKYWDKLNIPAEYVYIKEFAHTINYLPPERMEEGFNILQALIRDAEPPHPQLLRFSRYYKRTWLPLSDLITLWKKLITTTNACELLNRYLLQALGSHPLFFQCLGMFNLDKFHLDFD